MILVRFCVSVDASRNLSRRNDACVRASVLALALALALASALALALVVVLLLLFRIQVRISRDCHREKPQTESYNVLLNELDDTHM